MRKPFPMSFRKIFVITAAVAALGVAAGAAFAQTSQQKAMIDAAKAQGTVGEQSDGYLGFRQASTDPALTQAVTVTNNARRDAYARSAQAAAMARHSDWMWSGASPPASASIRVAMARHSGAVRIGFPMTAG